MLWTFETSAGSSWHGEPRRQWPCTRSSVDERWQRDGRCTEKIRKTTWTNASVYPHHLCTTSDFLMFVVHDKSSINTSGMSYDIHLKYCFHHLIFILWRSSVLWMGARMNDAIHVKVKIVKFNTIRIGFWGVLGYEFPIVSAVLLKNNSEGTLIQILCWKKHFHIRHAIWSFFCFWQEGSSKFGFLPLNLSSLLVFEEQ